MMKNRAIIALVPEYHMYLCDQSIKLWLNCYCDLLAAQPCHINALFRYLALLVVQ